MSGNCGTADIDEWLATFRLSKSSGSIFMRYALIIILFLTGTQSIVDADVVDFFEDLQPVDNLFSVNSALSDSCGETCNMSSSCNSAPAPTMLGGSSLGLPFLASDAIEMHHFTNFYTRVSENNSAVPQDRIFFNYNFLNDVPVAKDLLANARDYDGDLSHYELGLEKTLFDGDVSIELLLPFAYLPPSDYSRAVGVQSSQIELQNIAFGLKGVLWRNDRSIISVGTRIEAPTREDVVNLSIGYTTPRDVWAVTPYLAVLHNFNDDLFFQTFASYRLQTDDFTHINRATREPNYLDLDAQVGYWLYRNQGGQGLTGMQAKFELHYTGTFEPYSPSQSVNGLRGETDQLNLTTGFTALLNNRTTVSLGMVLPIREGSSFSGTSMTLRPHPSDRFFDWQAMLQVSYYFGNL